MLGYCTGKAHSSQNDVLSPLKETRGDQVMKVSPHIRVNSITEGVDYLLQGWTSIKAGLFLLSLAISHMFTWPSTISLPREKALTTCSTPNKPS
jgi:hypothetical protein